MRTISLLSLLFLGCVSSRECARLQVQAFRYGEESILGAQQAYEAAVKAHQAPAKPPLPRPRTDIGRGAHAPATP